MTERPWPNEKFECAPGLKLRAHERVTQIHHENMCRRMDRLEELLERLERRLWIAVYGVVAAVFAQGVRSLIEAMPG